MPKKAGAGVDAEAQRLITIAKETLETHFAPGRHHVACALKTKNGNVYRGLHLDCAGFDSCAEPTAIASACLAGDAELALIVAVQQNQPTGKAAVVNPCGNCLQHLLAFAPDIKVITQTPLGLQRLPLSSLLPYPYALNAY